MLVNKGGLIHNIRTLRQRVPESEVEGVDFILLGVMDLYRQLDRLEDEVRYYCSRRCQCGS